jgi:subtilase family serine protease
VANTGHQIQVGILDAFQGKTVSFPSTSLNGTYSVVADPKKTVIESDENNNTATFLESTATPRCGHRALITDNLPLPSRQATIFSPMRVKPTSFPFLTSFYSRITYH